MSDLEIRLRKLESRVADIEKHTHGDDCGCVHCEQGAKAAAYFEESRKLEPDAYKDLSGLDLTDMFSTCGDIKTETHPTGTVDGLRAELDQAYWKLERVRAVTINEGRLPMMFSKWFDSEGKAIRGKSAQHLPPHISQ